MNSLSNPSKNSRKSLYDQGKSENKMGISVIFLVWSPPSLKPVKSLYYPSKNSRKSVYEKGQSENKMDTSVIFLVWTKKEMWRKKEGFHRTVLVSISMSRVVRATVHEDLEEFDQRSEASRRSPQSSKLQAPSSKLQAQSSKLKAPSSKLQA